MVTSNYKVEFTEECLKEMEKIYNYIKNNLYANKSAKNLMKSVEDSIICLSYAPKLYAEITQYRATNEIYRRITIKKYVLLYTVDEVNKKVYVSHMYYGGQNYLK